MAVDTTISTQKGFVSPGLVGAKVVVAQREHNFATASLASAAWFEFIHVPAGFVCLGGMLEVVTACTGSGTIAVGVGGGNTMLTATAVDTAAGTCTAFTQTTPVLVGASGVEDDISILAGGATISTGKVRVTVILADCRSFTAPVAEA
jgi:hypothetical protein